VDRDEIDQRDFVNRYTQSPAAHATRASGTVALASMLMFVPVLGRIWRLGLGRAGKQAPHRADTEKDADDGTEPEPEHT
jgi:hypothetical protein